MEGKCNFFVVKIGKPFAKLKRIWYPNTLRVPTPVRSDLSIPLSKICLTNFRYCSISNDLKSYLLQRYEFKRISKVCFIPFLTHSFFFPIKSLCALFSIQHNEISGVN